VKQEAMVFNLRKEVFYMELKSLSSNTKTKKRIQLTLVWEEVLPSGSQKVEEQIRRKIIINYKKD